jgi:hypothetical protein
LRSLKGIYLHVNITLEDLFLKTFIKKLSGTLKNRKREKEDPDYPFIKKIYSYLKYVKNIDSMGYHFTFKLVEILYYKMKKINMSPDKIVNIFTRNEWNSSEAMEEDLNNCIKLYIKYLQSEKIMNESIEKIELEQEKYCYHLINNNVP